MDFRHRPALAARRHLVLTAYLASVPVNSALSAVRACSKRVELLIPFLSLNLQLSIEDPDLAENFNLFTKLSFRHSRTSLQMPVYHRPGGIQSCPTSTGVSSMSSTKRCGVSKSRSVNRIREAGPLAARARHQFGRPGRDGARQRPSRTRGKSSSHGQSRPP